MQLLAVSKVREEAEADINTNIIISLSLGLSWVRTCNKTERGETEKIIFQPTGADRICLYLPIEELY